MQNLKKVVSVILSIVLLVQLTTIGITPNAAKIIVPEAEPILTAGQAEAAAVAALDEAVADGTLSQEASPILGEVVEMRDENTKHYRHIDGSYTAAMHDGPVHFRNSAGEWQDIDNTLSLDSSRENAAGRATYTPAASGLDIRIPQDFADGQMITVGKDGYTVGLGVSKKHDVLSAADTPIAEEDTLVSEDRMDDEAEEEEQSALDNNDETALLAIEESAPEEAAARRAVIDISKVKADVNNDFIAEEALAEPANQTAAEKIKADNAKKMALDNLSSAVTYRDIFPGADLQYQITPTRIKESIIVKELQEKYEYLFDLSLDGLILVPQEDG